MPNPNNPPSGIFPEDAHVADDAVDAPVEDQVRATDVFVLHISHYHTHMTMVMCGCVCGCVRACERARA